MNQMAVALLAYYTVGDQTVTAQSIHVLSVLPPTPTVAPVLPTATPLPVVQPTSVPVSPAAGGGAAQPFTCNGGCATPPDPSCAIKGNVNSKGERIYHTPSSRSYNNTDVKPEEGDRWFCTEDEARAAGFRAPLN